MSEPCQIALPTPVPPPDEIARKLSFAGALELCANAAGYDLEKQQSGAVGGMDKARWSRIKSGGEGIKWDQLKSFMDAMGNPVPVLWMLHQCGFDLHSIRQRESIADRKLREAYEEIDRLKAEREVAVKLLKDVRAA